MAVSVASAVADADNLWHNKVELPLPSCDSAFDFY